MYEISNNITIEAIDQLMYSWDVDQNSPNRIAHQGAFLGCIGDFPQNSIYLRYDISAREIEKLIVAEYRYRSIKSDTYEEFLQGLKNIWNNHFNVLVQNIINAEEFTVTDDDENVVETVQDSQHSKSSGGNTNKFSNTPNQYISSGDGINGLTTITDSNDDIESSGDGTRTRTLTTRKGHNNFERWLELSQKNRNLVYEFIDKFKPLFMTTFSITRI